MGFRPDEQRQNTRHKVNAPYTDVTIFRDTKDAPKLKGHAYDVSLGGIRIELDAPLEAGEYVRVDLRLPRFHDQPIKVAGRAIRFCDPDELGPIRMGIMFTQFDSLADYEKLAHQLGEPLSSATAKAA